MCLVGDQGHGGVAEDIYYVLREGEPLFLQWLYACIPLYTGYLVKGHTGSFAGESSLQNARPLRLVHSKQLFSPLHQHHPSLALLAFTESLRS